MIAEEKWVCFVLTGMDKVVDLQKPTVTELSSLAHNIPIVGPEHEVAMEIVKPEFSVPLSHETYVQERSIARSIFSAMHALPDTLYNFNFCIAINLFVNPIMQFNTFASYMCDCFLVYIVYILDKNASYLSCMYVYFEASVIFMS